MAKTNDYMDYLDSEIGIAPANSQEEFQAAESIVEIMKDHDLEPTIQEFDAHPLGSLLPQILAVIMFVGVVLSGIGPTGVRLLGLLLALVPAFLLIMRHMGHDVLSEAGPASKSQNVIGVHRATGDKVTKGNRPIVVVAHYDTPRESPLFERLAPYQATLSRLSTPCVVIAAVAALLQLFGFLPGALRVVLWIVGIAAMIPPVVVAFATFVEKASPCTLGANDNKSSVAALLGLLDQVRPMSDRAGTAHGSEGVSDVFPDEADASESVVGPAVYGTHHGKEVLEDLGVLPDTCEIVYETPKGRDEDAARDVPDNGTTDQDDEPDISMQDGDVYYQSDEGESYEGDLPDVDGEDDGYAVEEAEQDEAGVPQAGPASETADQAAPEDDESYAEGPYAEESMASDDEEAWSEDDSWTNDSGDDPRQQAENRSAGGVKDFFSSLRQRFSRRRKDSDVSIPRGAASDGVDYSEFEETDWGGDSWDEEQQESPEELKSINRDDLIARRSSMGDAEETEEPTPEYEEDETEDAAESQGYEEPDPEGWGDELDSGDYGAYDADSPSTADDSQDESIELEDEAAAEEETPAEGRTSHDISHDNGPDWSIVEEQEESTSAYEAEDSTNAEVYEQSVESSDNEYGLESMDLIEVEEELEEDQTASAPIRERKTEPRGVSAEEIEASSDASSSDVASEAELGDDTELSWDDSDTRDGTDDDDDVLPKDSRGLDTLSDDFDAYEGEDDGFDNELDEPEPIDDPTWGETSYVPPRRQANVARRATLYDVPSPSEDTSDPLADDSDHDYDNHDERPDKSDGQEDGSGSNRARDWKGGAAIRSDLLEQQDDAQGQAYEDLQEDSEDDAYDWQSDGEELAPDEGDPAEAQPSDEGGITQDDLQDAILEMGDDLLISHDIWFVAVGSSSVNHAGIRAFLSDFRQDIRGAFLINLDSVGAGELSILTSEGLHEGRRSDRRLVRLVANVADDLHLPLAKRSHDWGDTDATPAMRSRVRAVTIMGVDQNGLPALSHTEDDVPENVDPGQVSSVVRLIAEAIRRS